MNTGSRLSIMLFIIVAILHGMRVVLGWDMIIGGMSVPVWASVLGVLVPLLLAGMLFKEANAR